MKSKWLVTGFLSAMLLFSASIAQADDDSACVFQGNIVSAEQILKTVKDMGFTPEKKYFEKNVKLKDECIYKVEAKDQAGQQWKLFFDPTTGKLIAKKSDND
jgi:hypothetical protein